MISYFSYTNSKLLCWLLLHHLHFVSLWQKWGKMTCTTAMLTAYKFKLTQSPSNNIIIIYNNNNINVIISQYLYTYIILHQVLIYIYIFLKIWLLHNIISNKTLYKYIQVYSTLNLLLWIIKSLNIICLKHMSNRCYFLYMCINYYPYKLILLINITDMDQLCHYILCIL